MDAVDFDFQTLEAAPLPTVAPPPPPNAAAAVLAAMAHAEAETAALREAAHAEGFAAGHAEALAALEPALTALAQAAAAVQDERVAAAERLERHAVDVALMLAEEVLAGTIAVEPERVVESVRGA